MTGSPRAATDAARLVRLGFADPARAAALWADPALAPIAGAREELQPLFARVADPDLALLSLVRLLERAPELKPPDRKALHTALREAAEPASRVLSVMGASTALSDHLVAQPHHWRYAALAQSRTVTERIAALVAAVTEPLSDLTGEPISSDDALRLGYRRELLGIAALDVTSEAPIVTLPQSAADLADLAQAALEAALTIACQEAPQDAAKVRLAIIGMGKTGGRELNYVSDVDVIFVAEPRDSHSETEALAAGARLATRLMHACGASTAQGTLWPVDAALRPEGKDGPLVRTVASHLAYYQRWAKTWEFQALLKARPVAGDLAVGQQWIEAVHPLVWHASSRPDFVDDVQTMRRRVEKHVPAGEAERQLKLGPGGLRDVEFSVQLLQLVHGRTDEALRSGTTLEALQALTSGGFVGRSDALHLDDSYRYLRTLEHRIQLYRLRRTHLMPTSDADLRRLGRGIGLTKAPAQEVVAKRAERAREVRRLHERLFYRPLLSAVARLSEDDVRMDAAAARERLQALGYRDPAGALRHLEALTNGVSRTAAIQRQLLPVMLGWFADEADPDAGLLAFRKVSDDLGSTHWYLRLLRDESRAAETLARTLGASKLAGDLLLASPEAIQLLGEADGTTPRTRANILGRMRAASSRRLDPAEAVAAVRAIRRVELFRTVVGDLFGQLDLTAVGHALTDINCATVQAALEVAVRAEAHRQGEPVCTDLLVVGMGRFGGHEMGYASDADVLFVHQAHPHADESAAQEQALAICAALRQLLGAPGSDPPIGLDADLRPEGKNGPLVRSVDSYEAYYRKWAATWESQALLRAEAIAVVGSQHDLAERFLALINPLRWPVGGLRADQVREIRRLKARMEAERLPRGADPKTHLKLGHGGLSDVEWTLQLLQLQHAAEVPALQTTETLAALAAAEESGLVTQAQAEILREAWSLASRLRNAGMLYRGRPMDSVPSNLREADGTGRIIGMPPQSGAELAERYRRAARRARGVTDELFFGI